MYRRRSRRHLESLIGAKRALQLGNPRAFLVTQDMQLLQTTQQVRNYSSFRSHDVV
jgi:hypothetical protein